MRCRHPRNTIAAGLAAMFVASVAPGTAVATPTPTAIEPTDTSRPAGEKDVVLAFSDARGLPVLMRRGFWNGSTGYGWQKIQRKHLIGNMRVVQGIIQNPDGGEFDQENNKRKIYPSGSRKRSSA